MSNVHLAQINIGRMKGPLEARSWPASWRASTT